MLPSGVLHCLQGESLPLQSCADTLIWHGRNHRSLPRCFWGSTFMPGGFKNKSLHISHHLDSCGPNIVWSTQNIWPNSTISPSRIACAPKPCRSLYKTKVKMPPKRGSCSQDDCEWMLTAPAGEWSDWISAMATAPWCRCSEHRCHHHGDCCGYSWHAKPCKTHHAQTTITTFNNSLAKPMMKNDMMWLPLGVTGLTTCSPKRWRPVGIPSVLSCGRWTGESHPKEWKPWAHWTLTLPSQLRVEYMES